MLDHFIRLQKSQKVVFLLIVGGTIPGLVVLRSIKKKQAEQAKKQHSSTSSASLPVSRLQPCLCSHGMD